MACTYDQKLWDCVSLAALFVLFWCMDSVGVFGNSLLPCVCSCVVQLMCRIEFCRRFQMRFSVILEAYNDVDWNTLSNDSKVTSGYVFNIAGEVLSWKSKKQIILAQPTMESEMIALVTTSEEASWFR
ncbi:hypothetical protein KIW84_035327 [Lathyrus oleraceus]|uniref:Uncharacterized protein n=1 Tax=Pisum sativum TaxID=3888 RepID=A0A9D4Y3D3_PEA|nr:hypothetical protein KIW84_035327 [Pisum sativum]